MSDIFISYASADRERAGLMARALEARGWSVWWDRTIPPGRQFDEVIEEALDAARCVVVLWSKASTASSWVKTEAAEAMRRKALIPALIDVDVKIPLEFRRLQAADLSRWHGEAATPEFDQFCAAIADSVAPGPPGPQPLPPPPPPPRPRPEPPPPPDPAPPDPAPPGPRPPGPEPLPPRRRSTRSPRARHGSGWAPACWSWPGSAPSSPETTPTLPSPWAPRPDHWQAAATHSTWTWSGATTC